MPVYLIKMTERGPTPRLMRREANKISKSVWEGTGYYWGENLREKHFTPAGAAEYGYRTRTAKYEAAKQRAWGHKNPLEWTGESKERSEAYRVTSTSKGARVTMNVPVLNYRRLGDELARVSSPEAFRLAGVWAKDYERHAEQYKGRTRNESRIK